MDAELELLDAGLPGNLPIYPGISLAARYVLTDIAPTHRGDGMKIVPLTESRVALMVGDVVGSGALASTTMARLLTLLRDRLQEGHSAIEAVRAADRYAASAPQAIGATVAVLVISQTDGAYQYASAGHPPPLLWSLLDGAGEICDEPSRPLGAGGHGTSRNGVLAQGDVVILYTDGALSAGRNADASTRDRIAAALGEVANAGPGFDVPDEVCRLLLSELVEGNQLADDIALLVAERTPHPSPLVETGHASAAYVAELAERLEEWLYALGAGLLDHLALKQAFTELGNNVVQHAYGAGTNSSGALSLRAELNEAGVLRLAVGDAGRWRDSTTGTGRGLIVAGGLVDSLQLSRTSEGTTVTLRQEMGRVVPVLQAGQHPTVARSPRTMHRPFQARLVGRRLVLTGQVDERCAGEFRGRVHEATRAGTSDTTIDLSDVTLLATSAVRVLFDYRVRAHASAARLDIITGHDSLAERVLRLVDLPHTAN